MLPCAGIKYVCSASRGSSGTAAICALAAGQSTVLKRILFRRGKRAKEARLRPVMVELPHRRPGQRHHSGRRPCRHHPNVRQSGANEQEHRATVMSSQSLQGLMHQSPAGVPCNIGTHRDSQLQLVPKIMMLGKGRYLLDSQPHPIWQSEMKCWVSCLHACSQRM